MKAILLSTVLVFFLWSCSKNKSEDAPEGILPKGEMINILVDLHLAESKVSERKESVSDKVALFNAYASHIYEQHNTDSTQYKNSHDYYMQSLDDMKEIYGTVTDSLQSLRDEFEKNDRKQPKKNEKPNSKIKKS
ncbi:MAG: hypothetical protein CMO01_22980 [Thalassobius sp.]|nr:hypothetical protein [Thalassovita sp.]